MQVYEHTGGLKPGMTVLRTGRPLSLRLGPGLIGNIFDGIQNPLAALHEQVEFAQREVVLGPAQQRDARVRGDGHVAGRLLVCGPVGHGDQFHLVGELLD